MIDDRTANRLLQYIACEVFREMHDGKTLAEIDDRLATRGHLKKKDRIAVFGYMAERWSLPELGWGDEGEAIAAHLRSLKRRNRKRSPQPTRPPATVLPFDRPRPPAEPAPDQPA